MSVGDSDTIVAEEKRAALQAVLASETLSRSSQLRRFLSYVCETAIAGRVDDINEYAIGIEALGRQPGYSLAEDSAVRSRAYELRQRLEKYYVQENPGAPIRISIPKGSYVPVFTRAVPPEGAETAEAPAALTAIPWRYMALAEVALLVAAVGWIAWLLRGTPAPTQSGSRDVQEAWGPLARPGNDDALVCVATKMHLLVRPNLPRNSTDARFPAFPELYPLFRRHRPLPADEKLLMEPADSSVAFGEVSAIATVARTLSRFGKSYQILPERIAPLAALRDRNAVVIGIPMDSDVVTKLLSSTVYTIGYHPAVDELAILDRRQPNAVPEYAARATKPERVNIVYGLVTVLPSEGQPDSLRRTVVFSGLGSVGTHGAADFFSSPEHIAQLRQRFRREGIKGFPPSYQVLVRCKLSDGLLLSTECVHTVVLGR
jgi:hypothetical protein